MLRTGRGRRVRPFDARVLGVCAPGHLSEFARGRALGYPVAGDEERELGRALGVPEVRAGGRSLYARAAVVLDRDGQARSLIHPVPEPGQHAALALNALAALGAEESRP